LYNSTIANKLSTIRTSQPIDNNTEATARRTNYTSVFNQFENFCNLPSNTGGRGDCMFVADAIRQFVVTGKNSKVLSDRTKTFQTDVYWPIRHQFSSTNSSYAAVYGNWVQTYDDFTGAKYWMPFSAHAAAVMARTDANEFPWIAPAGFNRGVLTTSALDLAINPNQKQRDELYKVNINPAYFSASDGMVIMGQKTLSRKPSAFDRINVRRLFLALERPVKKASKYFLFEPNTEFTRTRFVNTITPLLEFAKQNQGVYDYLIVADERVNTPEVIDNNELRADILIKPTRASEFILVTFTASRTDANFKELI
jgi:phage tail sheath protein FI